MNPRVVLRGLILIASLIGIGVLFKASGLESVLDTTWIDANIRGQGFTGEVLFVAIAALATGLGLPRQGLAFLAGYAFGVTVGTALALFATEIGCVVAFFYARFLGRDVVAQRFPAKMRRLDDFLHDNTMTMTLLVRMLPVGSNLATNLVAGVSRIRAVPFFTGSLIGYLPQTLVFALLGSGINVDPAMRISLGVVLFVGSGLLGVYLYRKLRHGKHLDEETERALEETLEKDSVQ